MTIGPGRYDAECEAIMRVNNCAGVALIVLGGDRGSGFSLVMVDHAMAQRLPSLLREMAGQIEADAGSSS